MRDGRTKVDVSVSVVTSRYYFAFVVGGGRTFVLSHTIGSRKEEQGTKPIRSSSSPFLMPPSYNVKSVRNSCGGRAKGEREILSTPEIQEVNAQWGVLGWCAKKKFEGQAAS